ncbi:MAG: hypothetical protein ACOYXB_06335 [Bacteroidota bacterium]
MLKYLKFVLLTGFYVFFLVLYFTNEVNRNLAGVLFDSFGLSCLAAFYILFLLRSIPVSLPDRYFRIRGFEKSGKIYRLLGVRFFKLILAKNFAPAFTGKLVLKGPSPEEIDRLEKQMRFAETIHTLAFFLTLLVMIPFGLYRDPRFFVFMPLFTVLTNLYPSLVQRFNRSRIMKLQRLPRNN